MIEEGRFGVLKPSLAQVSTPHSTTNKKASSASGNPIITERDKESLVIAITKALRLTALGAT